VVVYDRTELRDAAGQPERVTTPLYLTERAARREHRSEAVAHQRSQRDRGGRRDCWKVEPPRLEDPIDVECTERAAWRRSRVFEEDPRDIALMRGGKRPLRTQPSPRLLFEIARRVALTAGAPMSLS
jgi:hypothetical protein